MFIHVGEIESTPMAQYKCNEDKNWTLYLPEVNWKCVYEPGKVAVSNYSP